MIDRAGALLSFLDSGELHRSGDHRGLGRRGDRDGYVLMRGVLGATRVGAARARIEEACREHALGVAHPPPQHWSDPRLVALQAAALPSPELRALGGDPALLAIAEALLARPAERRGGDVCRIAAPHAPQLATPPHQDAHYLRTALPIWIAWIPLGHCPLERGPLAVLAGSHRGGLRPHRGASLDSCRADVRDDEAWTSGPLAPGDVLFLSALTVHRALANRSPSMRLSVDFRFGGRPDA